MMTANRPSPKETAILPLPGVVAFEGQHHVLHIFEPRYRRMIEHCTEHQIDLGLALPSKQISAPQLPAAGGDSQEMLARNQALYQASDLFGAGPVVVLKKLPDGRFLIAVNIERRVRLRRVTQSLPFTLAEVEDEPSIIEDEAQAAALFTSLERLSREILGDNYPAFAGRVPADIWQHQKLEGLLVCVMEWFRLDVKILQELLEQPVVERRAAQFVQIMDAYLLQSGKAAGEEASETQAHPEDSKPLDDGEPGQDSAADNVIQVDFRRSNAQGS